MSPLLDRLREVLPPRYEVTRELGGGGMGVVFLGRDRRLERPVAIKVLRPELATAVGTERFIREARILAQLSHPNIVPVHDADEAGGLLYYIMDYVEGETLEDQLRRGPLGREEMLQVGRDILAALETTHVHGIVHRDIKPANILLVTGRAMLADFGVARSTSRQDGLTQPGSAIGTPLYMAPEQLSGKEATPRSDLYAVGMVLFETLHGAPWDPLAGDAHPDWSGVPRALVSVLRRALRSNPADRWADATQFRDALERAVRERGGRRARTVQVVAVLVGAVGIVVLLGRRNGAGGATPTAQERIRVQPFAQLGGATMPWLAESTAHYLARVLSGNPDFVVVGPDDPQSYAGDLLLDGTVRVQRDSVCVDLSLSSGAAPVPLTARCGSATGWSALAEGIAEPTLREIWVRNLVPDLPVRALPRTAQGLDAFLAAERLFAQAQWEAAYMAYLAAEAADSTCWLCSWRIHDVERWLGVPHDPLRTARYLARVDSFPPHYAALMRASTAPVGQRIELERQAAEGHSGFAVAWWALGDDLFHRGPLLGHSRRDGMAAFARAAELRPDFAPAWEHLTLVRIAEGDREGAASALGAWLKITHGRPRDRFSVVVEEWLKTGLAWRFRPRDGADVVAERALHVPEVASSPLLPAGPRTLLGNFDAPEGAIWLGRRFVEWKERPSLRQPGLLALALGYAVLGRPDSAHARLREVERLGPPLEVRLFAAEFAAAFLLVDSVAVPSWSATTIQTLQRYAAPGALEPALTARAAGVLALLLDQIGSSDADRYAARSTSGFRALLEARQLARGHRWVDALNRADTVAADTVAHVSDPVIRAVARLDRAAWFARLQNPEAARRELRWAEHSDVREYHSGMPQAADADWGFRTLARWRLATTLDAAGVSDDEVCRAYRRVGRAWAEGAPIYRMRADSARTRAGALGCDASL